MQHLEELHKRFVIMPVDKGSSNILLEKLKEEVDNSGNFRHLSLEEVTIIKNYLKINITLVILYFLFYTGFLNSIKIQ